jgi:multidrug efflux pump subunit AcrB
VLASVNQGSASLSVTLVDPKERKLTQAALSNIIRTQMSAIPGLRVSIQDLSQQGFTGQKGYPIEFSVRGSDWDVLTAQATKLRDELTKSGIAVDVDTDYQIGSPELQIYPDRARASDVGIPVATIANTVSSLIGGIDVGQYSTAGRRIDVRMRVLASQRQTPEDIGKLNVAAVNGQMIPISAVTTQAEVPVL